MERLLGSISVATARILQQVQETDEDSPFTSSGAGHSTVKSIWS
jgi:hypothetical protein